MPAIKRASLSYLPIPSLDELQLFEEKQALQKKLAELQTLLAELESNITDYNQKLKSSLQEQLLRSLNLSPEAKSIAKKQQYATKIQLAIKNIKREIYNFPGQTIRKDNLWIEIIDPQTTSAEAIMESIQELINHSQITPLKLRSGLWIFKDYYYLVQGPYTDDQVELLILEYFDRERMRFERLKQKFDSSSQTDTTQPRHRIPEKVRIEVWQRDGGKCARCGSREKLEYDHIVPLSRGGSNTARNIELLCEKCNRTKGANPA